MTMLNKVKYDFSGGKEQDREDCDFRMLGLISTTIN